MKKFKKVSDADRFSILQPVMDRCFYCSWPGGDIHEIYGGAYRERSKAEGMCVKLCRYHHDKDRKQSRNKYQLGDLHQH